jgi:selenium metabolism protein YedF
MALVDARGKNCPEPVIMTKKAVDQGALDIETLVDNDISASNVTRFFESNGFTVERSSDGKTTSLKARRSAAAAAAKETNSAAPRSSLGYGVLITHKVIGGEDRDLGEILIKGYLGALAQMDTPPAVVMLMNEGVKLAEKGTSSSEHLQALVARNVTLLVCGTCLNHFGLTERLGVGQVSNMFEIANTMAALDHVVTF